MKTGLFFGSFNPVHIGHLIIANFMATHTDLKEVWMVVSPQNPLKDKTSLAPERERLHMLRLCIDDNPKLKASDIEFKLPKPSYTIDTLTYLKEKFPKREFVLIMGSDNLETLHKWKNFELLLSDYSIYVYNRPGFENNPFPEKENIRFFDAPQMIISASVIRKFIQEKKSVRYMVPESVFEYLESCKLYR
ncbi:MAG: nicotinate-nucleotide adenylyltransferase [Saprospiraceae bacterium]|nr:nicotinate-nucleotide adenylyltransferase [Saprospiraceae bacterium]